MKTRLLLYIFTTLAITNLYAETNPNNFLKKQEKESVEHNKTVTDNEIEEYFELFFKYQKDNLDKFRNQNEKEREEFLGSYRKSYADSKVKIPVLRGLSNKELKQFDEIAKYKAKESIEVSSAEKRLLSFDDAKYRLMINEGQDLISNYDDYKLEKFETRVVIKNGFPKSLSFLNLDTIYLYEDRCELLLFNGIGKDIGYSIGKNLDEAWEIKSFNHYMNWKSTKIDFANQ